MEYFTEENKKEAYIVNNNFENAISRYTKAPYVVTVDSATNALFLCLYRENIKNKIISIPSRTYVSVPCEIIHAGGIVNFESVKGETLKGAYQLKPTKVWDSALRFTYDMYIPNTHMCVSFSGVYKPLKLIKGGAILTDNYEDYLWFRRARFSGRNECAHLTDNLDMLGWNFIMPPDTAARGLYLIGQFYNHDGSPKHFEDIENPYADLSKFNTYK